MWTTHWKSVLICIVSVFCLFSQAIYSSTYDQIVAFGDSLSDNGNIYALTSKANKVTSYVPIIPKSPPYYNGRFSNGPIWIEQLAIFLQLPLYDYAYGGSWVESVYNSKQVIPFSLDMQMNFYLVSAAADFHKDKHLYVIWSGSNDYAQGREDVEYATENTISTIKREIDWLVYVGAKHFLILNLPDLGFVPESRVKGVDFVTNVSKLSLTHNVKLAKMLAAEKELYPDVEFFAVNVADYFADIIAHPDKFSLKNVTDACYGGGYYLSAVRIDPHEIEAANKIKLNILDNASLRTAYLTGKLADSGVTPCENPDEYLFWDQIHPTGVVHQLLAKLVINALNGKEGIEKYGV